MEILDGIECHLATATVSQAQEFWAVVTVTSEPPSLQTFAIYSRRFEGIEPHFKAYNWKDNLNLSIGMANEA